MGRSQRMENRIMNILVIGGTRGTGREVTQRALARGHRVTALVREGSTLDLQHPALRIRSGDALDPGAVAAALEGHDAVVTTLGAPARRRTSVREDGARSTLQAMRAAGVRRLITLSSMGVGDSFHVTPLWIRYLLIPLFLRRAFADHLQQEACIRASGVDWTIVRPPSLTGGPPTGTFRHGELLQEPGLKYRISRADVAEFMLRQLETDAYVGKLPCVSN